MSCTNFENEINAHLNRPLDICEILSRKSDTNVVIDTYEFFMKKCRWNLEHIDGFPREIKNFLLCVWYDGDIGNGGITEFLLDKTANAHQTADALHEIGAFEAETLLRKSFSVFENGIVPNDLESRKKIIDSIGRDDNFFLQLDTQAYNIDIEILCYKYLMDNKELFLSFK